MSLLTHHSETFYKRFLDHTKLARWYTTKWQNTTSARNAANATNITKITNVTDTNECKKHDCLKKLGHCTVA